MGHMEAVSELITEMDIDVEEHSSLGGSIISRLYNGAFVGLV